ncbi:MAG: OmpA family protein [Tannerella sp.]|nr:OmpA family protein [Tannerella sp.]
MKRFAVVTALCAVVVFSGCKARKIAENTGNPKTAANAPPVSIIGTPVRGTAGALIGKQMGRQKHELDSILPKNSTVETVKNGEALRIIFASGVLFVPNSSTVGEQAKSILHALATSLKKYPDADLKIVGYTDNTGHAEYNRILSEKRAKSVYDFLTARGVGANRMTFEGKGSREPAANNQTEEGRKKNRRVEIFILASNKMIQEARK